MPDILMLIGRICMAAIMVIGGFEKLMSQTATTAYIQHAGLPVPTLAWATAVFVELVVGLAFMFGLFTRASAAVLAAWCIVTASVYHSDFSQTAMQIQFMKNLCMTGGFLYAVAVGAGAFSVDAMLARRRLGAPVTV